VDEPFLAHVWELGLESTEREQVGPPAPDVVLWRAVHDRAVDVDAMILPGDARPLVYASVEEAGTIEVFTEVELSCIHALWTLARLRGREEWRERCLGAIAWCIEHLQPDNATNHPWAAHVFIIASQTGIGVEAEMYADTLYNNCQVMLGRADWFSAMILKSASHELELLAS
jgi:hypothetical protein